MRTPHSKVKTQNALYSAGNGNHSFAIQQNIYLIKIHFASHKRIFSSLKHRKRTIREIAKTYFKVPN